MINTVIFDIGAVLTDFRWYNRMEQLFDKETARIVSAVMWENPDWQEFDKANLSDEEILKKFIAKAPDYESEIRLAFSKLGECQNKVDYAIPWIKELKAMGKKVLYLSNYFEYLMHVSPEAIDFIPYTDGGIFSCYEHIIKPDHEIFRRLCERYELDKSECLFIDDSARNVTGAESFGIRAYRFESYEKSYPEIMEIIKNS